jgi:hypothetical protein
MPWWCLRRDPCREPSFALRKRRAGRRSSCRLGCCSKRTVSWCRGVAMVCEVLGNDWRKGGKGGWTTHFPTQHQPLPRDSRQLGYCRPRRTPGLFVSAGTTRATQGSYSRGLDSECTFGRLHLSQRHQSTSLSQTEARTCSRIVRWSLEASLPHSSQSRGAPKRKVYSLDFATK